MRGLLIALMLLPAGAAMAQVSTQYGPGPVPSLPLVGGTVTGTIGLDAAGVASIPNTSIGGVDGTLIRLKGGAGTAGALATQFETGSAPGVLEQWQAVGGMRATGPVLRAKSQVGSDAVNGVFSAQMAGGFQFGNDSGFLLSLVDSAGGNDSWLQVKAGSTSGGTNAYPILSAVGTSGVTNIRLGLSAMGASNILMANSNGTLLNLSDPNASGVAHNAFWQIEPGVTTGPPTLRVVSSDTSEGGTITMQGSGGLTVNNGNGTVLLVQDGNASGTATVANLQVISAVSGGAPTTLQIQAGSASNSGMRLTALGTGSIDFLNRSNTQARIVGVNSAARTVDIYGGTSSGSPTISPSAGNMLLGVTAPATNATEGFIQIGAMAGAPSGTPSNSTIGGTITYDSTNKKLCVYDTAWRCSAAFTP